MEEAKSLVAGATETESYIDPALRVEGGSTIGELNHLNNITDFGGCVCVGLPTSRVI